MKLLYSIADTGSQLSLGRTTIYQLLGTGELKAVKAGSRTRVTADSIAEYLSKLPAANIASPRKRGRPLMTENNTKESH